MAYVIITLILIIYIFSLIKNIYLLIHKQNLYSAIKNKKILKLSSEKSINFKDDYDFVKFAILKESVETGIENILTKPSEKAIKYVNIMLEKNIENYEEFINQEKQNILKRLSKSKINLLINMIISLLVIITSIVIIF